MIFPPELRQYEADVQYAPPVQMGVGVGDLVGVRVGVIVGTAIVGVGVLVGSGVSVWVGTTIVDVGGTAGAIDLLARKIMAFEKITAASPRFNCWFGQNCLGDVMQGSIMPVLAIYSIKPCAQKF